MTSAFLSTAVIGLKAFSCFISSFYGALAVTGLSFGSFCLFDRTSVVAGLSFGSSDCKTMLCSEFRFETMADSNGLGWNYFNVSARLAG